MQTASIAIIGGGLSGLYAAFLLQQRGVNDYVLFEARETLGGRIESASVSEHATLAEADSHDDIDRFDTGPTWYWPSLQPELDQLIRALDLSPFEQYEAGDMVMERSPNEPPVRTRGYQSVPAAMRLIGGMKTLVEALHRRVDGTRIHTGHLVRALQRIPSGIEVNTVDLAGKQQIWGVEQLLIAIPPRLFVERIAFSPALPDDVAQAWRETATWMAPHAKYIAVYDTPFWRQAGLSGEGRSARGPLVEIHDASMPGGSAALFGFFGVPASVRLEVSEKTLRAHCRAQLARLFGPKAADPKVEFIKDWAREPYTATTADLTANTAHTVAPETTCASGPWAGYLTGIGSEWSRQFPGYVAGAIDAASQAVTGLRLSHSPNLT